MFLIFLYEESYLKFLVNYLEMKKVDPNEEEKNENNINSDEDSKIKNENRIQKSFSINFQKNTKVTESDTQKVSKFLQNKKLGKELIERTESMKIKIKNQPKINVFKFPFSEKNSRNSIISENDFKNLILMSSLPAEKTSSNNTLNVLPKKINKNKELSKEETAKYERNFFILAKGGIFSEAFWKNEKIIKFCCENLEMQFSNALNQKFICSYLLSDLNCITEEKDIQTTLIFKKERKLKNLSLIFSSEEELKEFMEIYQILSKKKKKSKNNELEIKDFLKKNLRRYSWLNQPFNALLPQKTSTEYSLQIINEDFHPTKQILHLNFIHKIISFLRKDKKKPNCLKEFNIQKIIHLQNNFQDSRKITIKLEKKKSINVLFSNVQNKLVFESSINSILVN